VTEGSTFNGYRLADGLVEAPFAVRLVNVNRVKQYDGLTHRNDFAEYDRYIPARRAR